MALHLCRHHQQDIISHEGCSCYGACVDSSSSCVMSRHRLSPYDDHSGGSLQQDLSCGFSPEPPVGTVFRPGSIGVGLDTCNNSNLIQPYSRLIHSPCLQLDGLRYETGSVRLDPHSPICMVPLPEHIGEPSFIRKRNERERERVRSVNDGYDKLKEHLPLADKDRRLSKVETLRGAIKYIRQLKRLLELSDEESDDRENCSPSSNRNKRFLCSRKRICSSSSLSSSTEHESSMSDS